MASMRTTATAIGRRVNQTPSKFQPPRRNISAQGGSSSSRAPSTGRGRAATLALTFAAGVALTVACSLPSGRGLRADAAEWQKSESTLTFSKDFKSAIAELKIVLGDKITTNEDELASHGDTPNTHHKGANPSVVLYAATTDDVSKALKIANAYRMPVTAFSGATSLEGHITAPFGGLSVDLSRMDKILKINEADGDLVCQSGARWQDINEELEEKGIPLFFPLDPGPGATIGGMAATGCSGTNAVRYGTARSEWFLNFTVVLPDGRVMKTRSRARKSAAGFDLTKLFIGSEGTLGIVTEATIRLAPVVPNRVAICSFPNVFDAVNCVVDVINAGLPVQCAELCDAYTMRAINTADLCKTKFSESDSLFFKFQGDEAAMERASQLVGEFVERRNGTSLRFAKTKEESDEIWHGRKVVHWSLMALNPGCKMYPTDVCVPISQLPTLVAETAKDLKASGIKAGLLGHAGDGNFHAGMMFNTDDEFAAVDEAAHRLVKRAQALDGTCTGEHGIGVGKKAYLRGELGDETVALMQTIKDAVDPRGIMNPGKLYPDRLAVAAK